jgi:hypothetical protein
MPTPSEEQSQIASALNNLAAGIEHIQVRYEAAQRANRRMRAALFLAMLIILGGAGYWVLAPVVTMTSALAPRTLANLDPNAIEAERQRLKGMLSNKDLAQIEEFEAQIIWVRDYLKVFGEFDAGAAITLFLGQMNSSIKFMPAMHAEVRAMRQEIQSINAQMLSMNGKMDALPMLADDVRELNGKMNALPVLATEVQGIHRQAAIMAAGMDSTMGRAGRMMPWIP